MMKLSLIISVLAFPGLLVVALAPPSGGSTSRSVLQAFRDVFTSAPFWNFADPHTFSNKKSYEICDFFSESPVGLYESKGLSISGSLPRIAGSNSESWGSLVSSVFIKFTNGESVVSYTAKSASSPLSQVFDGQKDQVYHPKTGQLWLELYTIEAPKGESSIVVHDFNTDIFVMIHQQRSSKNSWFNIIVQGNTSESSGLLVDGCPEKYVDRKKPEALEVCRGISGSTDKSLNSTIAETICNHDTPIDPEMGSSVRSIVEMMNIFRDIVDSWFISNLVKAICK